MRTKVWSLVIQAALLLTLVIGCKKADDPATPTPTPTALTLVGNWKITGLTLNPAWVEYTNATPVPDYISYLKTRSETCLTDVTISFAAAGTYSSNSKNTASCGSAPASKIFLDYLFEDGATFTETDTQAVLYGKGKITSLPVAKSGTSQLLTLQFQLDEDISAHKIKTTYSITMARQ